MKAMTRFSLSVGLAMSTLLSSSAWAVDTPIQPKVMLITMFAPEAQNWIDRLELCLLYTSPSPRDRTRSRMPSSA